MLINVIIIVKVWKNEKSPVIIYDINIISVRNRICRKKIYLHIFTPPVFAHEISYNFFISHRYCLIPMSKLGNSRQFIAKYFVLKSFNVCKLNFSNYFMTQGWESSNCVRRNQINSSIVLNKKKTKSKLVYVYNIQTIKKCVSHCYTYSLHFIILRAKGNTILRDN